MQCEERRNSRGAAEASSQAGQDPALYRCRRKGDLQGEKKNPPCLLSRRPCELQRVSSAENPPQGISSKVFPPLFQLGEFWGALSLFFGGHLPIFPFAGRGAMRFSGGTGDAAEKKLGPWGGGTNSRPTAARLLFWGTGAMPPRCWCHPRLSPVPSRRRM